MICLSVSARVCECVYLLVMCVVVHLPVLCVVRVVCDASYRIVNLSLDGFSASQLALTEEELKGERALAFATASL